MFPQKLYHVFDEEAQQSVIVWWISRLPNRWSKLEPRQTGGRTALRLARRLLSSCGKNINSAHQRQCSDGPKLKSTAQAADAPPCNTDGALPLITLSRCSQSDESAFCRYFTRTTRLCPFLCHQCSPASHFVVVLLFFSMFLFVYWLLLCCFSVRFRPWIRYGLINQPFI